MSSPMRWHGTEERGSIFVIYNFDNLPTKTLNTAKLNSSLVLGYQHLSLSLCRQQSTSDLLDLDGHILYNLYTNCGFP